MEDPEADPKVESVVHNPIILAIFPQKLCKIEKKLTGREEGSLAPLRSATEYFKLLCRITSYLYQLSGAICSIDGKRSVYTKTTIFGTRKPIRFLQRRNR